jgi:hypothetical protein
MAKSTKKIDTTSTTAPKVAPVALVPNLTKLAALVNATIPGGFLYVPADDVDLIVLTQLKLADTNEALKDEKGNIAAKATKEGITYMSLQSMPEVLPVPTPAAIVAAKVASSSNFAIDDNVALPTIKRGGAGRQPTFPFEALAVGQSFHVPVSDERPEPAKTLASTVSSANARYAKETGEFETVTVSEYQTDTNGKRVKTGGHYVKIGEKTITRAITTQDREFVLRSVGADDPRGAGARVFRLR